MNDQFDKTVTAAVTSGGTALVSAGLAVFFFFSAIKYWETDGIILVVLGTVSLIGVFVGYFYTPASVLVRDGQVGFKYLFGPTFWFPRRDLTARLYLSTVKLRVNQTGWKAQVFGAVAVPLGVNVEKDAERLANMLGIPIEKPLRG